MCFFKFTKLYKTKYFLCVDFVQKFTQKKFLQKIYKNNEKSFQSLTVVFLTFSQKKFLKTKYFLCVDYVQKLI